MTTTNKSIAEQEKQEEWYKWYTDRLSESVNKLVQNTSKTDNKDSN